LKDQIAATRDDPSELDNEIRSLIVCVNVSALALKDE